MSIPDWADLGLSKDLPVLRARGENQELEYIESFPQNIRELAKEIAAFATSNAGIIIIGVADNGDLAGLHEAMTLDGRDQLLQRVEGICAGVIKPSVTPVARFAIESGRIVLVLLVPKGSQPVYYSHNVPYVRHITRSRPADPHEVIELIRNYMTTALSGTGNEETDRISEYYSELSRIVVGILVYADETGERDVNPWLESWRADFKGAASALRELAVLDVAREEGLDKNLQELTEALDKVATLRLTLGCGPELDKLTQHAASLARQLMKSRIDLIPLSPSSLEKIKDTIRLSSRKLKGLVNRSEELINRGQIEELQAEASRLGYDLLRVSYYNIEALGADLARQLQTLSRELHLVETMRLYADGGRSLQAVADRISRLDSALETLASQLSE